ncbi:MAG: 50S ribosomal protein L18Ae [Candidatus Methanofastidiosia archaeon]
MLKFEIKGKFLMGNELQKFTKEVVAQKKEHAIEKIYCEFGSKHRVIRSRIFIEEVQEV